MAAYTDGESDNICSSIESMIFARYQAWPSGGDRDIVIRDIVIPIIKQISRNVGNKQSRQPKERPVIIKGKRKLNLKGE
jgi:hypothetical protein